MAFEEAWRVGDDPEVKYLPGRLIFLERERPSPLLEAWLRDDVSEHADAMLQRREQGSRPCDGAWPAEPVDRFRSWMDAGKPE